MSFLKDKEKKLLVDRYVDIEWVDDVTDLQCVLCHRVAISHCVSSCQHIFCNDCRRVFINGGQWNCPLCQDNAIKLDDQDFDVEIRIHKLRICCPNKKYGCKYEDQLRKIPSHLMMYADTLDDVCGKKTAELMENTGTMDNVIKQLTTVHATNIRELKDKIEEKLNQLERKTDEIDSKFSALIEKMQNMEKILEVELATMKSVDENESTKSQLESMDHRIQKNESILHQMVMQMFLNIEEMSIKTNSMVQLQETLQYKISGELNPTTAETFEWTIKDVEKTISQDNWRFESDVFNFIGYKYDIKAKLECKQGIIRIHLQFNDGYTINQFLDRYGFTAVKYIVRDQSNIQHEKCIVRDDYLDFDSCFNPYEWILGCWLPNAILSPPYTIDDCLKIFIALEPPSIDRSFVSNDGVLMWTVDNYKMRKQQRLYSNVWSPSFYTSARGYRVRTRLLINSEQTMVVSFHFLTGEHDHSLSINFPHKTTVTLFNQNDPSKNLVRSEKREDVKLYTIQLGDINLIEENGFIDDDSLVLEVVIERKI